jgi:hypothetical protein
MKDKIDKKNSLFPPPHPLMELKPTNTISPLTSPSWILAEVVCITLLICTLTSNTCSFLTVAYSAVLKQL